MYQTIDEFYEDVMAHGTGPAKVLITEEACMSGQLAKRLICPVDPAYAKGDLSFEHKVRDMQREIMALLHAHRSMVIANFLMERAEGHPMQKDGPIVTAKPLMEEEG